MATPLSAIEPVLTALVTQLKASTGVTGLLSSTGAIYNDVPQNAVMPYVEVGLPTEHRWDTLGCMGKRLTVQVRAVTNGDVDRGDKKGAQILSACIGALHFNPTTGIAHHLNAGMVYDSGDTFQEIVSGVRIRHTIGIFRILVTQST